MQCTSPIFLSYLKKDGKKRFNDFKAVVYTRPDGSHYHEEGCFVPCGQCIACRLNYGKFWSIRLMDELRYHDSACFATLTYDNESMDRLIEENEGRMTLVKKDVQDFWKRLRKERHVRYFCCGEYGDRFGRPHYHAIIYGVSPQETDLIQKHWQHGFVKLGTVTEDSCAYVCKYMTKKIKGREAVENWKEQNPGLEQEFVLMSRRPGIGGDPSPDLIRFMKENGFVWRKTSKSALPRYWKEKFGIVTGNGITVLDDDFDSYSEKLLTKDRYNDNIMKSKQRLFNK